MIYDSNLVGHCALLLFSVFISSISQVILKKSVLINRKIIYKEYINIYVFIAYFIFIIATLLTIISYKYIPLSWGIILDATSYIYVFIFGVTLFDEKITKRKLLGLFFIVTGIVVYSLSCI